MQLNALPGQGESESSTTAACPTSPPS